MLEKIHFFLFKGFIFSGAATSLVFMLVIVTLAIEAITGTLGTAEAGTVAESIWGLALTLTGYSFGLFFQLMMVVILIRAIASGFSRKSKTEAAKAESSQDLQKWK